METNLYYLELCFLRLCDGVGCFAQKPSPLLPLSHLAFATENLESFPGMECRLAMKR